MPGMSKIPAIAMPIFARRASGQLRASRIRMFTDVSSRKSTLSAKSETEPMARATANSMKK
jgi:hypothetical protein